MIRSAPLPWKAVSIYHQPSVPLLLRPYTTSQITPLSKPIQPEKTLCKRGDLSRGVLTLSGRSFCFCAAGQTKFCCLKAFSVCVKIFFQKCTMGRFDFVAIWYSSSSRPR
jgi:hypothetical protein